MSPEQGGKQETEKLKTGRLTRLMGLLAAIGAFVTAIALFGSNLVSIRENFSKMFKREVVTIPIALTEIRIANRMETDLSIEMHVQNKSGDALEGCRGQLNINQGTGRISVERPTRPDYDAIPAQRSFGANAYEPIVLYFFEGIPADLRPEDMELRIICAKPRTAVSNWEKLR